MDQTFLKDNQNSVDRLKKVKGIAVHVLPVDALTGGVLHAKYMVADGQSVFVGSQNWDWRALEQIHEIGARIDDARFAQTCDTAFEFDWELAEHPQLPKAASIRLHDASFDTVTAEDPVILDDKSKDPLVAFPAFSPPALTPSDVTSE